MPKQFKDFEIELNGQTTDQAYALCPKCSHARKKKHVKCLSVHVRDEWWLCHHCGWSGSLTKGVSASSDPYGWKRDAFKTPVKPPNTNLPAPMVNYFKRRGINEAVLRRNRIGYNKVYMPQVEDWVHAIQFPYYRQGVLINIKSRDRKKNFRLASGAERILYCLHDISETTIIVEGEIDKLSLEAAGFDHCVSVPNGAPALNARNYQDMFKFLETAADELDRVKTFILAVDGDEPGKKLEQELSRRLGAERCKTVTWPDGCKDANEVLVKHGVAELQSVINGSEFLPVSGIISVGDIRDEVRHIFNHGLESGVSTGWRNLDEYYTVKLGEMNLVTGMPGAGKSNWLDAMAVNLSRQNGWRHGVFSPENQPIPDHILRIMEKYIGTSAHLEIGDNRRMTQEQFDHALEWVNEHFSFILPNDDDPWTIDRILKSARAMVYRRGINCLIIDPYNELEHLRPRNISETEYVSGMLSKIRKFSRKHSVAIWLVAHPTKMQKDKNTGQYPVPTPYDVAGSAHFRNKMDNCLTIFRPNYRDHGSPVEIHIQKIRDKQVGKHGQVDLFHDYPTGRYGVEFGCWSGNTQPEIPRQQEVDEDIFSLLAREESTGTIPSNDDVASNDDSDELPF